MFADSIILHAMTEAQSERRESAASVAATAAAPQDSNNSGKENSMPTTQKQNQQGSPAPQKTEQMQQEVSQSSLQQSQQQGQQQALHVQKDIQETAPGKPYRDPLGRPMYQGNPRFTDQQAGGDLTGDESDARDDNYVETGSGQHARDVSAHAGKLPAASAELLRSISVPPVVKNAQDTKQTEESGRPQLAEQQAAQEPEPDGTEDPGANADDGLVPRKRDGSGSEQH